MSRQLLRSSDRASPTWHHRRRSHFDRLGFVVGSVGGPATRFRLQLHWSVGHAIRCLTGRACGRTVVACFGGRVGNDLSGLRRGAIQPSDCRADRAAAAEPAGPHGDRFDRGGRGGNPSVRPTPGPKRTGDSRLSGVADRRESRTSTIGRCPAARPVRVVAAGRSAGGDCVSLVGRSIGQTLISG